MELTSRGPSQTAMWLPVGEREIEASDEVGNGKCCRDVNVIFDNNEERQHTRTSLY